MALIKHTQLSKSIISFDSQGNKTASRLRGQALCNQDSRAPHGSDRYSQLGNNRRRLRLSKENPSRTSRNIATNAIWIPNDNDSSKEIAADWADVSAMLKQNEDKYDEDLSEIGIQFPNRNVPHSTVAVGPSIYQVYVRNHGNPQVVLATKQPAPVQHGTFQEVLADLDRIAAMKFDYIYLLPIHPIGVYKKKGELGCPYSIQDYTGIDPALGNLGEFELLCKAAARRGMGVMLDVVFNHTSHDSLIAYQFPGWMRRDRPDMEAYPAEAYWSDVADLMHDMADPNVRAGMWDFLAECLLYWVDRGVTGFRCDVCSLVPAEFWEMVIKKCKARNPKVIFLGESIDPELEESRRERDLICEREGDLYDAGFDYLYDYDIWHTWSNEHSHKETASDQKFWSELDLQLGTLPSLGGKLRFTENHDQIRTMEQFEGNAGQFVAWCTFMAFLPGSFLVYAGQEAGARHTPSLFDLDPVQWYDSLISSKSGHHPSFEYTEFFTSLNQMKRALGDAVNLPSQQAQFSVLQTSPVAIAVWKCEGGAGAVLLICNLQGRSGLTVEVPLEDGEYQDMLMSAGAEDETQDTQDFEAAMRSVVNGTIVVNEPIVIRVGLNQLKPLTNKHTVPWMPATHPQ